MDLFTHRQEEFQQKLQRLRGWMAEQGIDNLLITEAHNFSWLTCGGENFVFKAVSKGSAPLLVTPAQVYLASNNIETRRMYEEELHDLPIDNADYPWHYSHAEVRAHLAELSTGSLVQDSEVEESLKLLRDPLFPDEMARYRSLGERAEEALRAACQWARPGMREFEVAAKLSQEALARKIYPVLLLIASDERALKYRHPLPTDKEIRQFFMLVLCARRYGLVVSLTRMVSFTPVSAELRRKHDAVCRVDASLILNSKPGVSYGEVLRRGILEYERAGFPEEWKLHHQGGPTGYVGRTVKVSPTTTLPVQASQAAAWNPSITGTKSEDTILIREKGFELLTQPRDWPLLKVSLDGGQVERCDILVKP